jgi:hypothetical protein
MERCYTRGATCTSRHTSSRKVYTRLGTVSVRYYTVTIDQIRQDHMNSLRFAQRFTLSNNESWDVSRR